MLKVMRPEDPVGRRLRGRLNSIEDVGTASLFPILMPIEPQTRVVGEDNGRTR
jgi:hypothetical protein